MERAGAMAGPRSKGLVSHTQARAARRSVQMTVASSTARDRASSPVAPKDKSAASSSAPAVGNVSQARAGRKSKPLAEPAAPNSPRMSPRGTSPRPITLANIHPAAKSNSSAFTPSPRRPVMRTGVSVNPTQARLAVEPTESQEQQQLRNELQELLGSEFGSLSLQSIQKLIQWKLRGQSEQCLVTAPVPVVRNTNTAPSRSSTHEALRTEATVSSSLVGTSGTSAPGVRNASAAPSRSSTHEAPGTEATASSSLVGTSGTSAPGVRNANAAPSISSTHEAPGTEAIVSSSLVGTSGTSAPGVRNASAAPSRSSTHEAPGTEATASSSLVGTSGTSAPGVRNANAAPSRNSTHEALGTEAVSSSLVGSSGTSVPDVRNANAAPSRSSTHETPGSEEAVSSSLVGTSGTDLVETEIRPLTAAPTGPTVDNTGAVIDDSSGTVLQESDRDRQDVFQLQVKALSGEVLAVLDQAQSAWTRTNVLKELATAAPLPPSRFYKLTCNDVVLNGARTIGELGISPKVGSAMPSLVAVTLTNAEQPALQHALDCILGVQPDVVGELFAMRSPPAGVLLTACALGNLFGVRPIRLRRGDGTTVDDYWADGRAHV
eukprot:TRINITY_DN5544_c0_g1_i2.p1 TRINITY_DN5544_c0_g1~~TRINITY_DN5544_c0_g1_i2.p1  ORF type:complete len:605 (+),score=64.49 TRINITY_DN5544_c0_g1_i2:81-1895(+)